MPAITHAYNMNMNGVDIGDQIHQYNNYHHAIRRGHFQAIYLLFYHGGWALCPLMSVPILNLAIEVILTNIGILRNENHKTLAVKKQSHREIRLQLVRELINRFLPTLAVNSYTYKFGREPVQLPGTPKVCIMVRGLRRACAACSQRRLRQRFPYLQSVIPAIRDRRTEFACNNCMVPLCDNHCWKAWHTATGHLIG